MTFQPDDLAPDQPVNNVYQWRHGPLQPNYALDVSFTLTPQAESDAVIPFKATGAPNLVVDAERRVMIQAPKLEFRLEPAANSQQVEVGGTAAFVMVVANTGNQTINDITITLEGDPGLAHASNGSNVASTNIGFLTPGQNRTLNANFIVQREGQLNLRGTITSAGQPLRGQVASIRGLPSAPKRPAISVVIQNDLSQTRVALGSKTRIAWAIVNTGEVPLKNGIVEVLIDPVWSPLSMSAGFIPSDDPNLVRWRFNGIPLGQAAAGFAIDLQAIQVSPQANVTISVKTDDGLTDTKVVALEIVNAGGATNIRARKLSQATGRISDQLEVNIESLPTSNRSSTSSLYHVIIDNARKQPDQKVVVSLQLPEGTSIQSVKGPVTRFQWNEKEHRATLAPINFMRAGEQVSFTIELKHSRTRSTEPLRAFVVSNNQRQPATAQSDTIASP